MTRISVDKDYEGHIWLVSAYVWMIQVTYDHIYLDVYGKSYMTGIGLDMEDLRHIWPVLAYILMIHVISDRYQIT